MIPSSQRSATYRERQRAKMQRVSELLGRFTRHYEKWMDGHPHNAYSSSYAQMTFGELREARALAKALAPQGEK